MSALDQSHASIWFRPDGTITDANPRFLDTMGYQLEDIAGKHHRIFLPSGEADTQEYRHFWERLRGGEYLEGEFRRIGQGGREVWLRATYIPITWAGRTVSVMKLATDITVDKQKTADSQSQVAAIGRSQAVIRFTPEGTVIEANDLFLQTMGYQLGEVEGKHHRLFVDADEARSFEYRQFWEALARGTPQAGEFRRKARGGEDVWLRATYTPIRNAEGAVTSVIKYAVDITALVRARTQYASNMESVIGTIRGIASQIDLVSLNAAIEAARVGAAGLGFGIVAEEIKKLASQVAAATSRIDKEIRQLRTN